MTLQSALADDLHRLTTTTTRPAIGVGVDVVEVREFEEVPFERNTRFYARVFTDAEILYCRSQASPAQSFAARFAAKEAAVKAFAHIVSLAYWQVEVLKAADGSPSLVIWDLQRDHPLVTLAPYSTLVSLTHTPSVSAAVVLVYGEDP